MADEHCTRERAAWVTTRAGRGPDAQRRGQRLSARARRVTRQEAGAGDSVASEALTRSRFARRAIEHEGSVPLRTAWAVVVEAGRLALAGPGIGLSWAIYGLWYRRVGEWGPLRWRWLAAAAGAALIPLAVVAGIVWLGSGVPLWGWWLLAQPLIGIGRCAWLAYAYGWDAVPTTSAVRPAPIRVRLGEVPELPVTEPLAAAEPAKRVRVTVPRMQNDNQSEEN